MHQRRWNLIRLVLLTFLAVVRADPSQQTSLSAETIGIIAAITGMNVLLAAAVIWFFCFRKKKTSESGDSPKDFLIPSEPAQPAPRLSLDPESFQTTSLRYSSLAKPDTAQEYSERFINPNDHSQSRQYLPFFRSKNNLGHNQLSPESTNPLTAIPETYEMNSLSQWPFNYEPESPTYPPSSRHMSLASSQSFKTYVSDGLRKVTVVNDPRKMPDPYILEHGDMGYDNYSLQRTNSAKSENQSEISNFDFNSIKKSEMLKILESNIVEAPQFEEELEFHEAVSVNNFRRVETFKFTHGPEFDPNSSQSTFSLANISANELRQADFDDDSSISDLQLA